MAKIEELILQAEVYCSLNDLVILLQQQVNALRARVDSLSEYLLRNRELYEKVYAPSERDEIKAYLDKIVAIVDYMQANMPVLPVRRATRIPI